MVIESSEQWTTHRKQLIVEINNSIQRIKGFFGEITIRLNGKIQSVDFNQSQSIKSILSGIESNFVVAAGHTTTEAEGLIDTAIKTAGAAATATDKVVFGSAVRLATGAPDVGALLKNKRFASGFRLSDKLWPQDKKILSQFYSTVEKGISGGKEVGYVVKQIAALKVEHAPDLLPKYLSTLESAARRAAQGLPGARAQYDRIADSIKKQLAKRKVAEYIRPQKQSLGVLGTRQATEAFLSRIEKAVNKGSMALIQEATDKHLVKQAEYHSSRAVRTMTARAFMDQGKADRKKRPWVIGEKWNLSPYHPRFDECDVRASMDYGAGPGVYRVGSAPYDHVNGLCYLTDVIDNKYLESDIPAKLKFKKGYRNLVKQASPGSDLCKFANKLGRQQNEGRIAEEMQHAGSNFPKWAVKSNVKKYSIDEIRSMMNEAITDAQKQASMTAKRRAVAAHAAATQRTSITKAVAAVPVPGGVPSSVMNAEMQKAAELMATKIRKETSVISAIDLRIRIAESEYDKQRLAEPLFTGRSLIVQKKRTEKALQELERIREEKRLKLNEIDALHDAYLGMLPANQRGAIPETELLFVPARSRKEAVDLTKSIIEQNNKSSKYPVNPYTGRPALRFSDSLLSDIGKISSKITDELSLEALNALNERLIWNKRISVGLGMPPIRGISADATGIVMASMGDGVLFINVESFNQKVREAKSIIEREIIIRRAKVRSIEEDIKVLKSVEKNDVVELAESHINDLRERKKEIESEISAILRGEPIKESFPSWSIENRDARRAHLSQYYLPTEDYNKGTLIHEIGHHIHQLYRCANYQDYMNPFLEKEVKNVFSGLNRMVLSDYAETDHKEFFAESFMAYVMGRKNLLEPEIRSIIERIEKEVSGGF